MKSGFSLKELIAYSEGGILSKELIKDSKINATLFCLAKGTGIGEHTSIKSGIIYVIEGKGEFLLGQEKIKMLAGVFISLEKNAVHSLKAEENTSFLLVLFS